MIKGKEQILKSGVFRKTALIAVAVLLVIGLGVNALLGGADGTVRAFKAFFQDDDVVAIVNGEEITQDELHLYMLHMGTNPEGELMKEHGEEVQSVMLDDMITMFLVRQKAEEEGFTADKEEVDEGYLRAVSQSGGKEQFMNRLEILHMTPEDVKEEIARDIAIYNYREYFLEEQNELVEEIKLEYTTEEYRQIFRHYGFEEIGDFNEVLPLIKQELKEGEAFSKHVEEIVEDSDIQIIQ